jgi:hypothetical protein
MLFTRLLLILTAATVAIAPTPAWAEEAPVKPHWTVEVPQGHHVVQRSYPEVAIAGGALLGAGWIATIAMTAATVKKQRGEAVGHSVVPVAGPFIELSQDYNTRSIAPVLVVTGCVQSLGLLALFAGATIDSLVLVPDSGARVRIAPAGAGASAAVDF